MFSIWSAWVLANPIIKINEKDQEHCQVNDINGFISFFIFTIDKDLHGAKIIVFLPEPVHSGYV